MPNTPPHLIAGETIRPHRFVQLDTTGEHEALEGEDNGMVIGISSPATNMPPLSDLVTTSYAAEEGQSLRIFGEGDICLVEAGGNASIAPGDRLKSDADGKAEPCDISGDTQQYYGARALQASAAAGTLVLCMVDVGSFYPALA